MTNPTSNFGWQMPTSTDLVTSLPADFEVFGQAVDTSLADLKGGTTGQVLKKNSNTDMDFVWSADSAGMTNPMTTTGDTIYSSSGSTPARLGIGTTGQVLTVSGGLPAWTTPAGGAWTLIASGSVGTGSTFTISSIPQTYKNIRIQLLNWSASGNGDLVWKINNTTADTFTYMSSSNAASNSTGTGGSGIRLSSGTVDASKTDNMGVLDIFDYTNTSAFKAVRVNALTWQNAAPSYREAWTGGGAYASTSAVTSLVFDPESTSTFDAGTYYLWGEN